MSRPLLRITFALALLVGVLACAAVAPAAGAGSSSAPLPGGPRLAFLEVHFPAGEVKPGSKAQAKRFAAGISFVTVDAQGHDRRPLFAKPGATPAGLGTVSWSADGEELAFVGQPITTAEPEGEKSLLRVYVARADGSHLHPVPGTVGTTAAVLSPDGASVAFTLTHSRQPKLDPSKPKTIIPSLEHMYSSTTTWVVPVAGGKPRRLTGWQNLRSAVPTSFSPDGALLAVTVNAPRAPEEVEAIDLATGRARTIQVEAGEAAFSPDGSRIAFTSYRDRGSVDGFDGAEGTKELYVANADGSGARRVTDTPEDDETAPSWDPSGDRLGFLRTPGGMLEFLGIKGKVMEANADGSCATVIAEPRKLRGASDTSVQPPTWVPGSGRDAGPLSC